MKKPSQEIMETVQEKLKFMEGKIPEKNRQTTVERGIIYNACGFQAIMDFLDKQYENK